MDREYEHTPIQMKSFDLIGRRSFLATGMLLAGTVVLTAISRRVGRQNRKQSK